MGYHYFKSFDEPNLSLAPAKNGTTIRLSMDSWGDTPFVLNMTCNEITIKIGDSGSVYPVEDVSKLTKLEQLHYNVLRYRFPIDTGKVSGRTRHYLDSLLKLYPELLSPVYYRSLLDKCLNYDSLPFKYSTFRVNISNKKFNYFLDKLNSSGFWNLPRQMSLEPSPADGGGYLLEVNTSAKYKMIVSTNCPSISESLTKVCQEIIDFAKPENRKMVLCY